MTSLFVDIISASLCTCICLVICVIYGKHYLPFSEKKTYFQFLSNTVVEPIYIELILC